MSVAIDQKFVFQMHETKIRHAKMFVMDIASLAIFWTEQNVKNAYLCVSAYFVIPILEINQ